ncbi:MAG: hypothetical protein RL407_1453 [Bacteroidota bacterium]|jgi:solute carrier family 10 (sodium/bile acid cotransporter), member 7
MRKGLSKLFHSVGLNGFLLGIFAAIGLAALFPSIGTEGAGIPWKPMIQVGISLVFFFYGLKLNPSQLREGLSNWKLHLLIQAATFLLFPFLVWAVNGLTLGVDDKFLLGISYLASLPSTVSAAVVLVSISRGNVAAAIFNASISSILGVLITPAWMRVFSSSLPGETIDFWPMFGEIAFKVLLPVILGLFLHKRLYPLIQPYLSKLRFLDQTVILMIVFSTFAESFSQNLFKGFTLQTLGILSGFLLVFLLVVVGILYVTATWGNFSSADRITAIFCGSTKSLVHGVAMGKVLFASSMTLGLVLLPVMLYHLQQLVLGSLLARFFEEKASKIEK